MPVCGIPYVHNPDSARMISRTQLKKEMVVLENSHDSSSDVENSRRLEGQRKTLYLLALAGYLVNSCQGEDAGVLFRLNYSIDQHTGIGCDTCS